MLTQLRCSCGLLSDQFRENGWCTRRQVLLTAGMLHRGEQRVTLVNQRRILKRASDGSVNRPANAELVERGYKLRKGLLEQRSFDDRIKLGSVVEPKSLVIQK